MDPKDLLKGTGVGLLYGIGIVLAVPLILPAVAAIARPLAKQGIKAYLAIADSVRETVAEAGEKMSDLVAEARSERSAVAAAGTATAVAAPVAGSKTKSVAESAR